MTNNKLNKADFLGDVNSLNLLSPSDPFHVEARFLDMMVLMCCAVGCHVDGFAFHVLDSIIVPMAAMIMLHLVRVLEWE